MGGIWLDKRTARASPQRGLGIAKALLAACLLTVGAPRATNGQVEANGSVDVLASRGPALLIQVAGEPVPVPFDEAGTVERIANASGELYRAADTGMYWLRIGKTWFAAADVEGPYERQRNRPKALGSLPEVGPPRGLERWKPRDDVAIYVRKRRSVLIRLDGPLRFERIGAPGGIHRVANTDADLFFHGREARYYLLVGGRWYSSAKLDADWSITTEIPPLFRDIPADDPQGYILAAIPGTREHAAALATAARVQLRSVPSDRTTTVHYAGTPEFTPIRGTGVSAAVNTMQDVFEVEGMYYACADGVWFLSAAPEGPWSVCAVVPEALYAIPSADPKYHVTAVVVYPAEQPGYVTAGADARYAGWQVVDQVLVHQSWYGPFPSGTIYAGEYVGPYASGEYLAPDYGNWGRKNWAAQVTAGRASEPMGAAAPRDPPQSRSTPDSRWELDARRKDLATPGTSDNPEWYGTPRELDDRRRSPRAVR